MEQDEAGALTAPDEASPSVKTDGVAELRRRASQHPRLGSRRGLAAAARAAPAGKPVSLLGVSQGALRPRLEEALRPQLEEALRPRLEPPLAELRRPLGLAGSGSRGARSASWQVSFPAWGDALECKHGPLEWSQRGVCWATCPLCLLKASCACRTGLQPGVLQTSEYVA